MAEIRCGFFALEDVSADASVGIVLPIFLPFSLCLPSPCCVHGPARRQPTRWFLTIPIYRAIRILPKSFRRFLRMGRCTAWNTCRCLPWYFPSQLPPTLLATVPATFPPTVSVFVPLSASGRGAPSHVVCKNDSGILIRHFAFKFNSLGLCSCNCKARSSGGEGTEGECSHPSVCAHMFQQREEGRPLWHFRLIWCLAPKQFSFLFCFYCLG